MKKVITIALLVICIISISSTICYAQEESYTVPGIKTNEDYADYNYKVVNKTDEHYSSKNSLTLYSSNTEDAPVACYIPQTYYFQPIKAADDVYTIVLYNDTFLYAKTKDITNKCSDAKDVTFAENVSPYFQNELTVKELGDSIKYIVIYKTTKLTEENSRPIFLNDVKNTRFIGLTVADKLYYYVSVSTNNETFFGYVLPDNTSNATINFATIKNHANYVEPEPEVNPENPTISTTDPTSTPATSNLVRNILIGVICILCIAIVMIVFKPNSNKIN